MTKTRYCDHPPVSEFGGDGSAAGESGSFASPGPASVQRAVPRPKDPVTRLSKVAGIIILLVGLAVTAYGGYGVVWSAISADSYRDLSILIASVVVVIGLPALLAGIGILRGAEWGRVIGILYSVLFSPVSFNWGITNWGGPNDEFTPLIGLTLALLFTYSAIVLMFRWRRRAIA